MRTQIQPMKDKKLIITFTDDISTEEFGDKLTGNEFNSIVDQGDKII